MCMQLRKGRIGDSSDMEGEAFFHLGSLLSPFKPLESPEVERLERPQHNSSAGLCRMMGGKDVESYRPG